MADARDDPEYVVAHVREALAAHPDVGELGIDVTLAGGKAFLTGVVATEERRDAVGRVATEALPGYEVRNQVSVGRHDEPGEVETL